MAHLPSRGVVSDALSLNLHRTFEVGRSCAVPRRGLRHKTLAKFSLLFGILFSVIRGHVKSPTTLKPSSYEEAQGNFLDGLCGESEMPASPGGSRHQA